MNSTRHNEVIQTILGRYSIRQFTDQPITREVQEVLLACGLSAPSGVNLKPCHISVAQRSELFTEINQEMVTQGKKLPEYADFFVDPQFNIMRSAALFLLFSANPTSAWYQYDAALMAGNINLAAESLGIGACLLGFARFLFIGEKSDYFHQRLQVPQGYLPLFGMILGYKGSEEQYAIRPAKLDESMSRYISYL
ncbi:MAG: nitroreductase family protein [Enterobacteriaceae bacterium]